MDSRNIQFMFWGLAVAWGIIAIYVVMLAARENRLQKQLESLKRMLEEKQ
jgi:CcmD family protein